MEATVENFSLNQYVVDDARGRFPTRDSLTCPAEVAPSTRRPGKVKAVTFRYGADNCCQHPTVRSTLSRSGDIRPEDVVVSSVS
ncbi:MAG: hypothetical protein QG671_858 [Actinomycetota bacterium]|nr:hypothetical protein [Actinomycetota bacterium]